MNDEIKLSGHISWALIGKNGSILKGETPNVITNYGKQWIAGILGAGATNSVWLGAGTSIGPIGAVGVSDIALFNEVPSSGYSYGRPPVIKTANNNTVEYSAYLAGITSPVQIRELGLFSSGSIGSTFLIAHQLVGQINMGPTYAGLKVTWIISLN